LRVNVENRHMERSDILRLLNVLKKTSQKLKG